MKITACYFLVFVLRILKIISFTTKLKVLYISQENEHTKGHQPILPKCVLSQKKKEKKRIDESVNFRIFQFHPLIKRGLKTKICYERKLKRISNFQKTKLFKLLQKAFI